jgi:23S rRNA (pseudouridine1915-N3)-methyltransferase
MQMNLTLLTVGKTDVKWVKEGLELYASRLAHYASFSVVEIPELKKVSALSREQIKEKEGELILKQLETTDVLILLDEHGRELRSVEFAGYLERQLAAGGKRLVFAVGGAYGFSEAVHRRCQDKLSLSKMTFSHQMVRTIFAEQLYRAFTILKGEPYHHE